MTEKATHGETLDALLCMMLLERQCICSAGERVRAACGDAQMALREYQRQGWSFEAALIRAIAAEEAADRLETARAALLDAAAEFISGAGDLFVPGLLGPAQAEAYDALRHAQNEWQDAQLQAYSPHEAAGLVEVTDG